MSIQCPACRRPVVADNEAVCFRMHEDCWADLAARHGDPSYARLHRQIREAVDLLRATEAHFGGFHTRRARAV